MAALITSMNRPRVATMQPHERKARIGRRIAFKNPRINATISTVMKALAPSIWMPGNSQAVRKTATAMINQRIKSFMYWNYL
jgi:hypothetical protein